MSNSNSNSTKTVEDVVSQMDSDEVLKKIAERRDVLMDELVDVNAQLVLRLVKHAPPKIKQFPAIGIAVSTRLLIGDLTDHLTQAIITKAIQMNLNQAKTDKVSVTDGTSIH